jgi:hypothetical protein
MRREIDSGDNERMAPRVGIPVVLILVVAVALERPGAAPAHPQHDGPHYCPKASPELGVEVGDFKAEKLIGLRLDRARKVANRHGCSVRVVRLDGEWLPVTADFDPHRINVVVVAERVKRIDSVH